MTAPTMSTDTPEHDFDVAIVGAGPFGLSLAAHLRPLRVLLAGTPMDTWEKMPPNLLLRSNWDGASLSAPDGRGTIQEYCEAVGRQRIEPIPLSLFLDYGNWFLDTYVDARRTPDVTEIARDGAMFSVTTADGSSFNARIVVIAVGVRPFAFVPPELAALPNGTVRTTHDLRPPDAGGRVLIVGGGQGALEAAAVECENGSDVEVVTRHPLRWFADREPHYERSALGHAVYRLAYPIVGFGPPPLNRLVRHPDLFAALPLSLRERLRRRLLRAGGSADLRRRLGNAQITEGRTVVRASQNGNGVDVELSDGSHRQVDEVITATGYRFDRSLLTFLSPDLRAQVAQEGTWPKLTRDFESTIDGIYFAGFPAEGRFGPISRFVFGCEFTAQRISSAIRARLQ